MRRGPFTFKIKRMCMHPRLLSKVDGSQDLCWGEDAGWKW